MSFLNNKKPVEPEQFVKSSLRPVTLPSAVDTKIPENSFWAVEEPFIVNEAIPRSLNQMTTKEVPHKTSFNIFSTFEEAAAYGQKVNKNLLVMEIKPSATIRPQTALVTKLQEAS
jgi:hypothetical protein